MTMVRRGLDALAVRRTLRAAGLRPQHGRSQNFLADPDVLEAILEVADPTPGTRVLEIGPGLGILTRGLLEAGALVTAIELDLGLAAYLRSELGPALASGSLRLIEGDALDQDLGTVVTAPFDVVANIPYHVTSPILHRLLDAAPRPRRIVLMVQAEVADRVAAPPGRMSYLSVFVQYHASVRVALRVPPEAFEPAPKVASAVIVIEPYATTALPAAREPDLWRLVQAGFRERRKMLRNVLARQLPHLGTGGRLDEALATAGIEGDRRPQTLSVDDWLRLFELLG